MENAHHRVLVVGGGNGGISVAARLRNAGVHDIAIVEPREEHLYKPLFSHVAGGTARASITVRPQRDVMPKGVTWIQDAVTAVQPETNAVVLDSGDRLTYDQLIVCPGIQLDWDRVPGLVEAMQTPVAASHYEFDLAQKASALLRDLTRGTVVFTQPDGTASCAGAAQKPMYQACDYWRATGVLGDIRVVMVVPTETAFLPPFDRELERKIDEYGIELRTRSVVLRVDADAQEVVLGGPDGPEHLHYDVLNVEPPQSAPDWLKASTLTAPRATGGFVEVDPETLRHPRFPNVWSLGDAAGTTNSKCGGALRKQTWVVAKNVARVLRGKEPTARYDGYAVCPFTVSRSTVVWAEFDDTGAQKPTIPFFRRMYRESRLSWIFDRHILPWVYWNLILTGRV
ncbi:FAD-dependent oxidoreductase [Microbacterium sp. M3]|uniref:FAD-dependent oxidoreductase n=1 Tax=Microbacterium arthrosphaerae TaxID=792652 RepID=A0ABU4GX32_9MICO|nr:MULTISPECIES: FAD-dependent oxidoreductase [Microbacterium]MDW4571636.1 FAD-dependent oxidoreductase [Microbacterium arthrosphaerae]MDW7605491.1 FAD-dependent oxidoreductase [Microbacterium sp. M3]